MEFPKRIRQLRIQHKLTQEELGKKVNVTKVSISGYENGNRTPDMETLQKIADVFSVNIDYLLGRTDNPKPYTANQIKESPETYYTITEKDERDIAKKLDALLNELDSDSALSFLGEPMSEEDRELLRISLENTVRLSKEMAKKKFTPKKYRN